jgi:hypothetical protein
MSELDSMVLKCEKTGKLFFSEAEAKLHSEETGLQAFAQVSFEEKVWICTETGKVCFNEQQMAMHKRFVPEAQTFEESNVGALRTRQTAAAPSSGPVEIETEEEMLLRNAGLAGKARNAAEAGPSGPQVVTKELVDQLLEMGFTELRAHKALVRTSNAGVEPAINWLGEHMDDADIDEPLALEVEVKPQEEVDAGKAAAEAGSQLTPAEKKAKLEDALAKARAKKAGIDVETQKEIERARRQGGKEMVLTLREQQEQQRKRDMEARKREKREFELERQKLREQLAKDKADKVAAGLIVPAKPAPAVDAAPAAPPQPAAPAKSEAEAAATAAAAAAAGVPRSYEEESVSVSEATEKMVALSEVKLRPALDLMGKMVSNIVKAPTDVKFRKMRLSNPKVSEGLVHVPGARQFLCAHGWRIVEREYLELPVAADASAQAAAQSAAVAALGQAATAAQEARRRAELDSRRQEAADRMAKAKAEKEAIKAAMVRDRGEVAARGPAQASVAKKLPTEGSVVKMNFDDDERPGQH